MAAGARRDLVVVENPAEARALGGLRGGFAVLEARGGRLQIRASATNNRVPNAPEPLPVPQWFSDRLGRFASARDWNNSTMHPDLRLTGPLLADIWRASGGGRVDGVIVTDVVGLARLLRISGPVAGPRGTRLDAGSFPALVMRDAYKMFPGASDERKQFISGAAAAIWRGLLAGADGRQIGAALAELARTRRLAVWLARPADERLVAELGLSGRFPPPGLFVGVTTDNAGANKVDYYVRREVRVRVSLADGLLRGHLSLALSNRTPSGLPAYVMGPGDDEIRPGDARTFVSVYLPPGSRVEGFRVNGRASLFESSIIPGDAAVVSRHVIARRGGRATVEVDWEVAAAPRGLFEFAVALTAAAFPDLVDVEVSAAPGMVFSGAGARLSRKGETEGDVTLEGRLVPAV